MSDLLRNISSLSDRASEIKHDRVAHPQKEPPVSEVEDSVTLNQGITPARQTVENVVSGLRDSLHFKTVPGLPHIAVASTDGLATTAADEKKSRELEEQMLRYMRAYPSVTSVITVAQSGKNESSILVESRPGSIEGSTLEGVYEVMKRLSSSLSIKEAAKSYPSKFHVVRSLNSEGTLHEIHLPGKQTGETLSVALAEGGKPNQLEQVKQLVGDLPKGARVALLLSGPSGAGKSTLIKQIREFAKENNRKVVDLQGDMYFKDIDDPDYPLTPNGQPFWDSTKVMDMTRFKEDIASLLSSGSADVPVYNFTDVRPGGWRKPDIKFTGFREDKPRHLELGNDDILVIDSLHAANSDIISHLDGLNLPHATAYLDSVIAEDRLMRRIVRDYQERGGILPSGSMKVWDETTWPGEVQFVRPTILQMDPAQDTFLTTKFPKDPGISKEEIRARGLLLEAFGLAPAYEAFATPPEKLGEFARAEEQRLEQIVLSNEAGEADRKKAMKELERLRQAPRYRPITEEVKVDEKDLPEIIGRLPKVDLHRHLEGAIKPETIFRVAQKYGIELPAKTPEELKPFVSVTENDHTLLDFLKKFDIIGKLFVNPDAIREISRQCVLDAKEENVKALELRFSPMYMASSKSLSLRRVMDAVIKGVREGEKETGITVALTTIIERQMGPERAQKLEKLTEEYVKKGKLSGSETASSEGPGNFGKVTSMDLANDEYNFPPGPYASTFQDAKKQEIHRTLHAGEARGADSVKTALEECQAERIGHGIRSFEDPELVKKIVDKGTVLEMCPTSNVQTQAIDKIENHPLKKFYDMGGKATINTDDPAVCDTDLNKEYLAAVKGIGCSLTDIENMTLFAVDAMFLPPAIKAALHREIYAQIQQANESLQKRDQQG